MSAASKKGFDAILVMLSVLVVEEEKLTPAEVGRLGLAWCVARYASLWVGTVARRAP